jgi:hypothetical protein
MATINQYYASYATQFMTLNLDEKSLFISIPSESDGLNYRVDINEETMQATSCNCASFKYRKSCKHCTIVNVAFAKTSAFLAEKSRQATIEAAMDSEELIEEQYALAEIADAIVAPKVRKQGDKLVLTAQTCKIFISEKPRRKFATEYVAKREHFASVKNQMTEIRERRMDGHSARTLDFFSNLPSRQEVGA